MPTYDSAGELFAQRRQDAGLSQQELATRARVGVSTISRLETNQSTPRARNLAKLAVMLGVTPEQLEAFGLDVAADLMRGTSADTQQGMREAFAALVDVEVVMTKLGFRVELSQPEEGVLLLRCERDNTPGADEVQRSALSAASRERESARRPPRRRGV